MPRTESPRTEIERGTDSATTGFEGSDTDGALLRMAFGGNGFEVHEPSREAWAPRPLGIGDVLGGRYALEGELGQGGFGRVFRGRDRIGRDEVAVKVLKAGTPQIRDLARREIGVLRFLQVPGVARLRDEGTERGCPYFVMDLIEGRPFPGGIGENSQPVPWEKLAPVVHSLLEVLGRVHGLGLAHLDLKPANVLVDNEGRVGLLDFGISEGAAVGDLAGRTEAATKEYASPEKIRGGAVGVRSDLYSLGVMIYRCLTGVRPCPLGDQGVPEFHRTESIRAHLRGLPENVADWIDGLLSVGPSDRPASIHSGLRVVSGDAASDAEVESWRSLLPEFEGVAGRSPRFGERDLQEVFEGPDIVLHLREDAARELWRRTLGCPERIDEVLSAWERAGLAHRVGPRYSVQRMALERLKQGTRIAPPPVREREGTTALGELELQILRILEVDWPEGNSERLARVLDRDPSAFEESLTRLVEDGWVLRGPGEELHPVALEDVSMILPEDHRMVARAQEAGEPKRLYHWIEAGELEAAVDEALEVGSRWIDEGRLLEAEALLIDGLAAIHLGADGAREGRLLRALFEAALVRMDDSGIDRALFELSRAQTRSPEVLLLENLLEAAIASRASSGEQAVEMVESLPEFEDPNLEGWRNALLAQCSRRISIEAQCEFIREMESLPEGALGDHHRERLHIWRGAQRYDEHAFEASAHEYALATKASVRQSTHGGNLGREATSWLEAGEPDRASALAEEMLVWGRSRGSGLIETWAHWILRTAAYRRGEVLPPLPGWLEAVDVGSSVVMRAPIHLQESSFHWRSGRFEEALSCAENAHRVWRDMVHVPGMLLSASMRTRCAASVRGGPIPGGADPSIFEPLVAGCEFPRVLAQSMALLRPAVDDLPIPWVERGRECLEGLRIGDPNMRWEVLCVREMGQALEG